jgi:folate-binding protein YgfZ
MKRKSPVGCGAASGGAAPTIENASSMTPVFDPQRPAFFDFSARAKFRLTGADVFRYLNGQITNDLRKATAGQAIQATILNAKGKLSAHVFISMESADAFLLDADSELHEELPVRLERYIIADDVQIDDVTERFSIFHLMGADVPAGPVPVRVVDSDRFARPGHDLWIESGQRDEMQQQLSASFASCDEACAEAFRIEQGIPRWGFELTSEIIPVEANLEAPAIDYAKGCYIGQEVISRMKMSGQTNKRLCGLIAGVPLAGGMRLSAENDPGKEAGWITSATSSARLGKEIALGYVKRGFNSPGTHLLTQQAEEPGTSASVAVEVVSLPFV